MLVMEQADYTRVLGTYGRQVKGTSLICIGGIHGNEPAGALALKRVLESLHERQPPFRGELVALSGNLRGLQNRRRYLHRDLNRMWSPERIGLLRERGRAVAETPEDYEQLELMEEIDAALERRTANAVFLDLHTTSSEGAPFAIISDTLTNRSLAMRLGVPLILGLEESIEGTLLNYINELGHAAIGFEAGQHDSPSSIRNHEAAIWLTLVATGCISARDVPDYDELRPHLIKASMGLPQVLELRYRHAITEADQFSMDSGYTNFYPVSKGQPIAKDCRGLVRVPEDGLLFMPLYQKLGEDGFFLVREVKPVWLHIAALARRLRLDKLLHLMPGVSRLPEDPAKLVIDTRVARWFALEICHLLGFRHHSSQNGYLVVSRRRQ